MDGDDMTSGTNGDLSLYATLARLAQRLAGGRFQEILFALLTVWLTVQLSRRLASPIMGLTQLWLNIQLVFVNLSRRQVAMLSQITVLNCGSDMVCILITHTLTHQASLNDLMDHRGVDGVHFLPVLQPDARVEVWILEYLGASLIHPH